MPIKVTCPACNSNSNAPDEYAGRAVKCPACKEPLRVPPLPPSIKPTQARSKASKPETNVLPLIVCGVLGVCLGAVVTFALVGFSGEKEVVAKSDAAPINHTKHLDQNSQSGNIPKKEPSTTTETDSKAPENTVSHSLGMGVSKGSVIRSLEEIYKVRVAKDDGEIDSWTINTPTGSYVVIKGDPENLQLIRVICTISDVNAIESARIIRRVCAVVGVSEKKTLDWFSVIIDRVDPKLTAVVEGNGLEVKVKKVFEDKDIYAVEFRTSRRP